MSHALKLVPPEPPDDAQDMAPPESWREERETLLELLAQQQRVAQAGLITSGLSHDAKNHIQHILGVIFIALRSRKPDDWKDALEQIQDQCCGLTEILDAFLDFVRRRDSVKEERFALSTVVEQVGRLIQPLAKSNQVEVTKTVEADSEVAGEARMAIQAVVNLASNAIRACAEKRGTVEIKASVPMTGLCRLTVADDGPGIPEDLRSRLFRPFATGHADSGGNGLGLFIVRQTVRRLGGSIRVRTSPDGTSFHIDLPAAATA